MTVRLATLVAQCGGEIAQGADVEVTGFAPLDRAGAEHLAFVADAKWLDAARASQAGVLVLRPDWVAQLQPGPARTVWAHPNPYLAFARASQVIVAQREAGAPAGAHPSAVIDPAVQLAPDASVGPLCAVGAGSAVGAASRIGAGCVLGRGVKIGARTVLHANVTVYDGCVIGDDCVLHSGAVIGAEGFGYARDGSRWIHIPQTGAVRIGNRVEIGANTTVDRGALDDTVIEDGVKLDNQIQIAHNVHIGEDTAMAGCVGIAGSTRIGRRCTFGGAAMVVGHIEIGDDVHISGGALVSKSIAKPGHYTGNFPIDEHRAWERNAAALRHLADLRARVRALESTLARSGATQRPDEDPAPTNDDQSGTNAS